MILRDRTTGNLLSVYDVRLKFPSTSFPSDTSFWNQQVLDFANVDIVTEVNKPDDNDSVFYTAGPIVLKDGKWTQSWTENTRPLVVAVETEEDKWRKMRLTRQSMLENLDKVVLKHKELTELSYKPHQVPGIFTDDLYKEILKYRQALRDLPEKIKDINNFEWPYDSLNDIELDKKGYLERASNISPIDALNS